MNKYVPIFQEFTRKLPYEFEQLLDSGGTLIVTIADADGNVLDVCFDSYMVYRKMDEGDALVALAEMAKTGGTTRTFYRVDDSEFVAWFNQQGFKYSEIQSLSHYVVATANDMVDVVAFEMPVINKR